MQIAEEATGFNAGVTVGFNIFDGNRRREKRNATLAFKNRRLERQELELALRSDLSNLWQAYRNNLQLLNLERQNLVTAKDNHDIAMDRYIQETFPVLKYARHKRVCWMPKNVFSRQNTTPNFAKFHYCKSAEKSPNIWSNKTLILLFHWANHLIKAISPIFMPLRTDITLHSRPFLLHLHTP